METKTYETRNCEDKVLGVLPPVETGVEVHGSSYFYCPVTEGRCLDGADRISDSLCAVPGSSHPSQIYLFKSFLVPTYCC